VSRQKKLADQVIRSNLPGPVQTIAGIKLVFVSVGHRIDLTTGIEYVLACCRKYRLPETTRQAHRLAASTGEILLRI